MTTPADSLKQVIGTVDEVLPQSGMAYVADEWRSWVITRATLGVGLHLLRPGQKLKLSLRTVGDAEIVSGYSPLDD